MKSENKPIAKEIITLLLQHTKAKTITSQYNRIRPGKDGKIRTSQSAVGTDTGRLNSRETFLETSTNMQNLVNPKKAPKLDPLFNVRQVVVPDQGKVLIASDLGQAELYSYLAYAGDRRMLDKLYSGVDLHTEQAAATYSIPVEKVTDSQRTVGKFGNFSLGYAGGWKMFLTKVNKDADITGVAINARIAKASVSAWKKRNTKTVKWWGDVERQVREKGFLTNSYGRKRIFIDRSNVNSQIAYLPQSTVADHLNSILVQVYDELDGPDFEILLQIHDEILGQASLSKHIQVARQLRKLMERPLTINGLEVKIPADVSVSRDSWAKMREVRV